MRRWMGAAFLVAAIVCFRVTAGPEIFDGSAEFPNLFLPPGFSQLSPTEQKRQLAIARRTLEKTTASVLRRLRVPIVGESGKIESIPYFETIQGRAKAIHPDSNVMPSSGLIRSVIGYLYEEMQNEIASQRSADPLAVLRKIGEETHAIDAIDVRSVGGDFDLLVDGPEEVIPRIQREILDLTNSAESALGAMASRDPSKRLFFTVGDVKPYGRQIGRTVVQGGSTIDWLAFDLKKGTFVEPPGADFIIQDLLLGQYRYVAPVGHSGIEEPQKQTVRGIRPLLELPFLSLADDTILRRELQGLIEKLEKNKTLDPKAVEQVGKAIRNGRSSLGNNRITRGAEGSVEQLVFKLSKLLRDNHLEHIPEYVYNQSVSSKPKAQRLNGFPPELLTSYAEFAKNHSDEGHVYHGTPTLDNGMAIMRGGLFLSGGAYGQGGSSEGPGGYAGSRISEAKSFPQGMTLRLKVSDDPQVNILVLDSNALRHPFLVAAGKKADQEGIHLNEYLRRHHGIDIIKRNAVLIQNMDAMELGTPKQRILSLVDATLSKLEGREMPRRERFNAMGDYRSLRSYAEGLGIGNHFDDNRLRRTLDGIKKEVLDEVMQEGRLARERESLLDDYGSVLQAERDLRLPPAPLNADYLNAISALRTGYLREVLHPSLLQDEQERLNSLGSYLHWNGQSKLLGLELSEEKADVRKAAREFPRWLSNYAAKVGTGEKSFAEYVQFYTNVLARVDDFMRQGYPARDFGRLAKEAQLSRKFSEVPSIAALATVDLANPKTLDSIASAKINSATFETALRELPHLKSSLLAAWVDKLSIARAGRGASMVEAKYYNQDNSHSDPLLKLIRNFPFDLKDSKDLAFINDALGMPDRAFESFKRRLIAMTRLASEKQFETRPASSWRSGFGASPENLYTKSGIPGIDIPKSYYDLDGNLFAQNNPFEEGSAHHREFESLKRESVRVLARADVIERLAEMAFTEPGPWSEETSKLITFGLRNAAAPWVRFVAGGLPEGKAVTQDGFFTAVGDRLYTRVYDSGIPLKNDLIKRVKQHSPNHPAFWAGISKLLRSINSDIVRLGVELAKEAPYWPKSFWSDFQWVAYDPYGFKQSDANLLAGIVMRETLQEAYDVLRPGIPAMALSRSVVPKEEGDYLEAWFREFHRGETAPQFAQIPRVSAADYPEPDRALNPAVVECQKVFRVLAK